MKQLDRAQDCGITDHDHFVHIDEYKLSTYSFYKFAVLQIVSIS